MHCYCRSSQIWLGGAGNMDIGTPLPERTDDPQG
jgi:hypothetical protein